MNIVDYPLALDEKGCKSGAINHGILPSLMGHMVRLTHMSVYQSFQRINLDEKLRPQRFIVLELVFANPGIRPSDVSSAAGISRTNLVPLLTLLEQSKWISRKSDKVDGRAQVLYLTPEGVAERNRLVAVVTELEERLTQHLGPDERDTFLRLLQAVMKGAEEI